MVVVSQLKQASRTIHSHNREKGFWDKPRETGTLLMLCVSELAEAMEADRKSRFADLDVYHSERNLNPEMDKSVFEKYIKDTFEDELADTVIRILDLCGALNINIDDHINLKLEYNKTRSRMHGGKAY